MLISRIRHLVDCIAGRHSALSDDQRGATAIEYALIAGMIGLAVIAGATGIGTSLQNVFNALSGALK